MHEFIYTMRIMKNNSNSEGLVLGSLRDAKWIGQIVGFKYRSQQFYGQSGETISRWWISLESLLPQVQHEDYLSMVLSCNLR